ncbi:MAG: flagellar protein export ATPase FliI [Cycloclasticus sp.]
MNEPAFVTERSNKWLNRLKLYKKRIQAGQPMLVEGKLTRMVGLTLEAVGCRSTIGGRCIIETVDGNRTEAEVVGFSAERLFLMSTGEIRGLEQDCRVIPLGLTSMAHVGSALLGRVVDGGGKPLDGKGPVHTTDTMPLHGRPINPLGRKPISEPLNVGIRAINSLLTVGRGQRLGLFAGSGVGKSVLLGMMTRYTSADVIVVGLIGERGREVNEFVRKSLGEEGLARAVVVATPADHPPLMRMHGAMLATSIAEYFRDQGKNVLLLMDSLTRYAQAQREIALAINEPPATKGYPPSVFSKLPGLVERAGNSDEGSGSITAFYTVLTEGDDSNDPIADASRAILDGHIHLSRSLAEAGHFPAIDMEASVSRLMTEVVPEDHQDLAREFRRINSTYQKNVDLVNVGAYQPGANAAVDQAIDMHESMIDFLQQGLNEAVDFDESLDDLQQVLQGTS